MQYEWTSCNQQLTTWKCDTCSYKFRFFFRNKSWISQLNTLAQDGNVPDDVMSLFKMKQQISDVIHEACCAHRNKTLPLSSSSPVHSYTDPALTPTAQPNVHTPPAPALYWNCSKAVKTPSFSHSLHPQRAGLKRTPSHALTNTHTRNTHSQKF